MVFVEGSRTRRRQKHESENSNRGIATRQSLVGNNISVFFFRVSANKPTQKKSKRGNAQEEGREKKNLSCFRSSGKADLDQGEVRKKLFLVGEIFEIK